eukprot:3804192-Rhodomonas_salina.1
MHVHLTSHPLTVMPDKAEVFSAISWASHVEVTASSKNRSGHQSQWNMGTIKWQTNRVVANCVQRL